MAIDREIACKFYLCEKNCAKGGKGTFWKACQICDKYQPRKGGRPLSKETKKQRLDKINQKDAKNIMKQYY